MLRQRETKGVEQTPTDLVPFPVTVMALHAAAYLGAFLTAPKTGAALAIFVGVMLACLLNWVKNTIAESVLL